MEEHFLNLPLTEMEMEYHPLGHDYNDNDIASTAHRVTIPFHSCEICDPF